VSYESGIDGVPRFDSHLELYSANKTVRVQYDTPYVKGLPVTLHIAKNEDGVYREEKVLKTYEDPYTLELKIFYDLVLHDKPAKTTAADSLQDLEVFGMAMKHYFAGVGA
jgi:predicted dehydrogenase